MTVLEAIREERDQLLAPILNRLTHLAELERLEVEHLGLTEESAIADTLHQAKDRRALPPAEPAPAGPVYAPPAAEPTPARRAPRTQTPPRSNREDRVRDYLEEHGGPLRLADIADGLGISQDTVRSALQPLVVAGSAVSRGATRDRRYYSPARWAEIESKPKPERPSPAADTTARAVVPEQLKRDIRDLIARNPGQLDSGDLAKRLLKPLDDIARACGALVSEKAIAVGPSGCYRVNHTDDD